jgi:glycosyltransferase involved in cell wall biosynthesis
MEQPKNKLNIGLLSPLENAYSETFVRAHKENLAGQIFYYYGGLVPRFLEGEGYLGDDPIGSLEYSFLKNKIDVVLAEFGYAAAESLPAIKDANIPLVVHFHGMDAHSEDVLRNHLERYKEFFGYAENIIVVSRDMERQIINLGCPKDKIVYTVCAPHKEYYGILTAFNKKQFLAVGRFVDKKAPYYTILAFKKAWEKYPDAKLRMAADGPLLNVCKNLVRYFKMQGSVEFIGVADRETIKKEMAESLAFVQHSITTENGDSEGTPVAVLEAGAAALPVIATRHAGIKDVVVEGKTGFLVDEHDVDGMAEAMIRFLADKELARKMGQAARERIKTNFSTEINIGKINEAIEAAHRSSRQPKWKTESMPEKKIPSPDEEKAELTRLRRENETIKNSKSFRLSVLFFDSIGSPRKWAALPLGLLKILTEDNKKI